MEVKVVLHWDNRKVSHQGQRAETHLTVVQKGQAGYTRSFQQNLAVM